MATLCMQAAPTADTKSAAPKNGKDVVEAAVQAALEAMHPVVHNPPAGTSKACPSAV